MLVLHTFDEGLGESGERMVRLLGRAREGGEWGLCRELSRFLVALDESGGMLRESLRLVDKIDGGVIGGEGGGSPGGNGGGKQVGLGISAGASSSGSSGNISPRSEGKSKIQNSDDSGGDYFSVR